MTDERLEQILKQALAPEVSDVKIGSDFCAPVRTGQKRRKRDMGKIIKSSIAAAACAALLVAAGFGNGYFPFGGIKDGSGAAGGDRNLADGNGVAGGGSGGSGTEDGSSVSGGNPFILTVYAAELEPDKEVPLVIGNQQSWALGGEEDEETVSYCLMTSFSCEGEGIESITYGINQGAFQVVELPEDSILVSAEDYEGELNVGMSGGVEDEDGNILSEMRFVSEYTVSYGEQANDTTTISICGEKHSPELMATLWPEDGNRDLESGAAAYSELLDGVEITCTAHFEDGTSASKTIVCKGKVMSYEEAGCPDGGEPDTKEVFIVFELKPSAE